MNDTKKSAKRTTGRDTTSKVWTDEERAAMQEHAKEMKAEARRGKDKADGERDVLAKIADDAEVGSRHGRADPRRRHGQRPGSLAEDLLRDARVRQGWKGRLLLPARGQVQGAVRDVRLQRRREPRRGHHVADLVGADEADRRRRDRRSPRS